MIRPHRLAPLVALTSLLVACALAGLAYAASQTDTSYFDGFQDLTGLDAARSQHVTLDALGGVRLATNGTPTPATWTTQSDFSSPAPPLGPLVGLSTLDAATTPGSLLLPTSPLAFRRVQPGPVLSAASPLSPDGYSVGGMCVQKVNATDGTYYMWYTGVPENEFAQKVYLATSNDGVTWTKETTPVLSLGEPGTSDSRQLGKPWVIYDPANTAAPFRMWYSAQGDFGGSIGYATSLDGRSWTKVGEVFGPGKPGMADSFSVSQPCILIDNGIYRMWYTADDSNNRRIGYATSLDGLTWDRGGIVFDITAGGNYSQGAYAPTVWKDGSTYNMVFTAAKSTGGGIQTKLYNASTSDGGITWVPGSVAHNPQSGTFDGFNMSQPDVLVDPTDASAPFKMWYVGNNPDANGNYHDRIGLVTKSSGTWKDVAGPVGEPYLGAVMTFGTQSAAFDSMDVADLAVVQEPGADLIGFYTGTNGADFTQRIGAARSTDGGVTWTRTGGDAALIGAGRAGAFDAGGLAAPAPVWDGAQWLVYHTSLNGSGSPVIGLHTVSADLKTVTRTGSAVLGGGAGGEALPAADPAVVDQSGALTVFFARDSAGGWSIARATGDSTTPTALMSTGGVLSPGPAAYDVNGVRRPVVQYIAPSTWRMWYTAIGSDGVSRIAYATSTDGSAWTKQGLAMSASTAAYDLAEQSVSPASALQTGSTTRLWFTGTDRFGWQRVGVADAGASGCVDGGTATYELDNTAARDWRRIVWNPATQPAGTDAQVWVSYFPTFSGGWSQYFQVQRDTDLPFLLTVTSMRWQVRMTSTSPSAKPRVDDVTVNHAPVSFPATGEAVTVPIGPPAGNYLLTWGDLTCDADVPVGAGVTLSLEDGGGAQVLAPQPLAQGSQTVSLATVPPASGPLVAVFDFTSAGQLSVKVKSLGVTFTSTTTPSTITLAAGKTAVVYGGGTTLTGTLTSDTTPLAAQTVTIEARTTMQSSFAPLTTAVTAAGGSFTATVKPTADTVYRASWPGGLVSSVTYPPASASTRVDVKPKVTLKLTGYRARSGKYCLYSSGRKVIAKGAVAPNHHVLGDGTTAGKVVVRAYRLKNRKWVFVKSSSRGLSTASGYSWGWTPKARGTYRLRTTFAGDTDHLKSVSVYRYLKVT
jgi:predicted GH43/DUF377 family glycosyl hydrolase